MGEELDVLERLVKTLMGRDPVHGFPHVVRVLSLCEHIADMVDEKPNMRVLRAAALLHDLGRVVGEGRHAELSAEIAGLLLPLLGFSDEEIKSIKHAILAHSFSLGVRAESIEAMILSDADKLDAIGAVGIMRVFWESARRGRSLADTLKHFDEKLLKLKDMMYTEPARRLAEERHAYMLRFLEQLRGELCLAKDPSCTMITPNRREDSGKRGGR